MVGSASRSAPTTSDDVEERGLASFAHDDDNSDAHSQSSDTTPPYGDASAAAIGDAFQGVGRSTAGPLGAAFDLPMDNPEGPPRLSINPYPDDGRTASTSAHVPITPVSSASASTTSLSQAVPALPHPSIASPTSASLRKRRLSFDAGDTEVYLYPASNASASKISCLECRASKTRCSGGEICDRCRRLGRECVYKEHRRGRFSDSKRVQHLEKMVESLLGQLRELQVKNRGTSEGGGLPGRPPLPSSTPGQGSASSGEGARSLSVVGRRPASTTPNRSAAHTPPPGPLLSKGKISESPESDQLAENVDQLLSKPMSLLAFVGKDAGLDAGRSTERAEGEGKGKKRDQSSSLDESAASAGLNTSFLSEAERTVRDHLDPIELGFITVTEAHHLFDYYMTTLEEKVTLLDPYLHTFEYVRSASSLLFTSICFVASLFDPNAAVLSHELEAHINLSLLPSVYTDGCRSVEIAQALVLLVNYHTKVDHASQDRSWQLVGLAARIGSALGLNKPARPFEDGTPSEARVRRRRNRVRTWLNIWICEMAVCEQLGRPPLLRLDQVILACNTWQLDPYAVPADSAIVCLLHFRLLLTRDAEAFERVIHSQQATTSNAAMESMVQESYRNAVNQLDSWLGTWSQEGMMPRHYPGHKRLSRTRLSYWYGRALTAARALRIRFSSNSAFPLELYRDTFNGCTGYLHQFLLLEDVEAFAKNINAAIVCPTYCAVVCLRVIENLPRMSDGTVRLNVDLDGTFALLYNLANALQRAATITPHRRSISSNYAPFLLAVLTKTRTRLYGNDAGPVRAGPLQRQPMAEIRWIDVAGGKPAAEQAGSSGYGLSGSMVTVPSYGHEAAVPGQVSVPASGQGGVGIAGSAHSNEGGFIAAANQMRPPPSQSTSLGSSAQLSGAEPYHMMTSASTPYGYGPTSQQPPQGQAPTQTQQWYPMYNDQQAARPMARPNQAQMASTPMGVHGAPPSFGFPDSQSTPNTAGMDEATLYNLVFGSNHFYQQPPPPPPPSS